jgi:hypothetical protein
VRLTLSPRRSGACGASAEGVPRRGRPPGRGTFGWKRYRQRHRSRHSLNADTIREMHLAFQRGGRAAINKVMKQQPAVFLKLAGFGRPRLPHCFPTSRARANSSPASRQEPEK